MVPFHLTGKPCAAQLNDRAAHLDDATAARARLALPPLRLQLLLPAAARIRDERQLRRSDFFCHAAKPLEGMRSSSIAVDDRSSAA
jgi:hypothetical protein